MVFLVVLGHTGGYDPLIRKVIYSFHMPVFVFLSGYLTSSGTPKEKRREWFIKTVLIYACAQAAHVLLGIAAQKSSSTPLLNWQLLTTPRPILWYLVSLIFWRLLAWSPLKKLSDVHLLILSFALALASGLVPLDREFSFQRTFAFFPFFAAGVVSRRRNLLEKLEVFPVWAALVLLAAGLYTAWKIPWSYQPKFHYAAWNDFPVRLMQTLLGFLLCFSIVRLSRENSRGCLSRYGKYTLWIYIGHSFLNNLDCYAESAARRLFPGFEMNLLAAALLALVYCTVCIVAAKVLTALREYQKRSLIL